MEDAIQNEPKSPSPVTVTAEQLASQLIAIFVHNGFEPGVAEQVVDVLVWADLHGKGGHGAVRVPRYLEMTKTGEMDPSARPHIAKSMPATTLVEANRAPGAVAMAFALDAAIAQAKVSGASITAVRRTTHTGAIGYYALKAAQAGYIAMIFAASKPIMAYHGSRVPSLSTSPLAIAIPSNNDPIVLDMATSATSLGNLKRLAALDGEIPIDWALDERGEATSRAREAELLLPVGGAKGAGLALMFEAMTGILAGWPILAPTLLEDADELGQNCMIILTDPSAFGDPQEFRQNVDKLSAAIHGLPLREGFDAIFLPGERAKRQGVAASKNGIRIPAAVWKLIKES